VIKNAPRKPATEISMMLTNLSTVLEADAVTKADIVHVMGRFLPGFHHIETGKNLDQKM
jgi:hypothetical protein